MYFRAGWLIAIIAAMVLLPVSSASAAAIKVDKGWDLYQTTGATFNSVPMQGVPIGSYDFGAPIGIQSLVNTDTIVQRLSDVLVGSTPNTASTNIVLDAFDLVTSTPVNFGLGVGFYYLTLQSSRGGPASTGTQSITFADGSGGTFDSTLDIFYDVRLGSISGPIAISADEVVTSNANPWGRNPPSGADLIAGANYHLDGSSTSFDIWATSPPVILGGASLSQSLTPAALPEPASALVFAVALPLLRRSKRR